MEYPGKIRIIGGRFRSRKITVLKHDLLRPTPDRVRETVFNWLQSKVVGARCLDCFAGTGILGFEALSRGAEYVTLIDSSSAMSGALKKTSLELGLDSTQCQIIQQEVSQWLRQSTNAKEELPYDLVFLDPPFNSELLTVCLDLLVKQDWLSPDAWIYIEMPSTLSPLTLQSGWAPFKSKIAGQVGYHLLAKI